MCSYAEHVVRLPLNFSRRAHNADGVKRRREYAREVQKLHTRTRRTRAATCTVAAMHGIFYAIVGTCFHLSHVCVASVRGDYAGVVCIMRLIFFTITVSLAPMVVLKAPKRPIDAW